MKEVIRNLILDSMADYIDSGIRAATGKSEPDLALTLADSLLAGMDECIQMMATEEPVVAHGGVN